MEKIVDSLNKVIYEKARGVYFDLTVSCSECGEELYSSLEFVEDMDEIRINVSPCKCTGYDQNWICEYQ